MKENKLAPQGRVSHPQSTLNQVHGGELLSSSNQRTHLCSKKF